MTYPEASTGPPLLRSASWYLAATAAMTLAGVVSVPFSTRWLTPGEFGAIAVATSVAALFRVLWTLGLEAGFTRIVQPGFDRTTPPTRMLSTVTLAALGACVTLAAAAMFLGGSVFDAVHPGTQVSFSLVRVAVLASLTEQWRSLPLLTRRAAEDAAGVVRWEVPAVVGGVAARLLAIGPLHQGAAGWFLASALVDGAIGVGLLAAQFRRTGWGFSVAFWKRCLGYCAPLVPSMGGHWALNVADRLVLERWVPVAQVGVYGLAYQIGRLWNEVNMAVAGAWSPRFIRTTDARSAVDDVSRTRLAVVAALLSGSLAFALPARELVTLAAPAGYAGAADLVPVIVLAYACHSVYVGFVPALFQAGWTRLLAAATVGSGLLNVAINLWWVPRAGIQGAAWATAVSFAGLAAVVVTAALRASPVPAGPLRSWATLAVAYGLAWPTSLVRTGHWGIDAGVRIAAAAAFYETLRRARLLPGPRDIGRLAGSLWGRA